MPGRLSVTGESSASKFAELGAEGGLGIEKIRCTMGVLESWQWKTRLRRRAGVV